MKIPFVEIIGIVAGILTTISALPQLIKCWKSRSVGDLSIKTFILITAGVFLWFLYGLLQKDYPILVTNLISFVFNFLILVIYFKEKYRSKNN